MISPSVHAPASSPTASSAASGGDTASERATSVKDAPVNTGTKSDSHNKEPRVPLACLRCRSKRARCSGVRPRCKACEQANAECMWPDGRRRKRTRKEMEEAECAEREKAKAGALKSEPDQRPARKSEASGSRDIGAVSSRSPQAITPLELPEVLPPPPLALDTFWSAAASSFIWPPDDPSSSSLAVGPSPPGPDFASELLAGTGIATPSDQQTTSLMRALQSQTAFIEGDPFTKENLELYYYRAFGSTAIRPGISRISLKLQIKPPTAASAPIPSVHVQGGSPNIFSPHPKDMFDENNMPLPHIHLPLLDTFFRTMGQHFPSVSRKRMNERLETGTMSALLLNCICAIGARFHGSGRDSPAEACAPFITRAQELLVPLLHLPAYDCITGLLLLAWACYGQNSDAAHWQYAGMAFRMAFDLGLHEESEIYESRAHQTRTRLLFWTLFVTDRIISFSTGRPCSIPEEIIEIPLPTDADFFPEPTRDTDPVSLLEPVEPVPFCYLVRILVLCGRIAAVLNGRRGRARTLVGLGDYASPQLLSGLQTQLIQYYTSLPSSLRWCLENFKHQEARGHGGTFLTLHLWANAVMALVYHPELTMSPSGTETPFSGAMQRSIKLALSSSRNICECLVFADLFSSQVYLGNPFSVQPIYVACCAFILDIRRHALGQQSAGIQETVARDNDSSTMAEEFLTSLAKQNLLTLMKALQRMEHFWAGIAFVSTILERRAETVGYTPDTAPKSLRTFISLPDKGLLERFSDKDLPHNTAAATDTSLRTSIEKDAAAAQDPFSVEDLLSTYHIQGLLIEPANNYDLERLFVAGATAKAPGSNQVQRVKDSEAKEPTQSSLGADAAAGLTPPL